MTDNAEAQAAPGANVAAQDGAPQPAPAAAAGEPANGAPPGKTPAEVHAAESKRRQEDEILQRARRVRQMKDAELAAQKEPFQPPSRNRSHWDVLLQEARWMATDFMQERNWKISAAVQIAREVYAQKAWKNLKKVPDAELPQAKSWVACGVKKKNAWKDFEGDWQAVDVGPYWRAGQDIEADAGAAAAGSGRSGRRGGRKGEPKAAGDERGQWEPDPIDPDLPQPAPPATAPGAAHFAYACPPTLANSLASDLEAEEAKLRAKHEAELSDHEVELEACRRAQEAARAAMAQEERARAAAAAQDAAAAGRKSGARKRVPGKQARRAGGEDDGEDLYGVRRGRRGVSDVDDEEMDGRGGRAAKRRRDMDDDAAESTGPARSSKRRQGAAAGRTPPRGAGLCSRRARRSTRAASARAADAGWPARRCCRGPRRRTTSCWRRCTSSVRTGCWSRTSCRRPTSCPGCSGGATTAAGASRSCRRAARWRAWASRRRAR
ncbi:unnamed protein product [Pedinophyceae sp. YPF-701]|nr:unnamed protein product [Pedinophyceae sp. YPF-701]